MSLRRLCVVAVCALSLSPALQAQSLADAAAAGKARTKPVDATKVITNKDLAAVLPATAAPARDPAVPAATTVRVPDTLAVHARAADTLLGARIEALATLADQRDQSAAQYHDACAGKATSAGWLLRGELIMTPNAETPACRTIASDHAHQVAAFKAEHAAIAETARANGIFPGVLRDLFAQAGLPE